jgi:two-component system NarL family sensor kinase
MQIPAKDLIYIISLSSLIFLIAPFFLVLFVFSYNKRKKENAQERLILQKTFESEMLKANMEVREQTMQTIGADLHDNIGQLLGLTSLTLRSVEMSNPVRAKEKINTVEELISKSISELRQLGKVIQGGELMKNGIAKAIEYELCWLEKSGTFSIDFINRTNIHEHNPDKDLILFRLLQEVLNNIIKHSGATHIMVSLQYENQVLTLTAKDNGVGFCKDVETEGNGMGLHNIQVRAALIGASVSMNTAPGEGTEVVITLPYP